MSIRKTLRDFGVRSASIYFYNGSLHIFFSNTNVDEAIAECLHIPIYINGRRYNFLPGQNRPP